MSVLVELTAPADEFVLADTMTAAPDMRIEIKRVVAGTEEVTPYFWASGGDFDAFEQALRDDEWTRDVLTLEEHGDGSPETAGEQGNDGSEDYGNDERFYRVTWKTDAPNLIDAMTDAKAAILEAVSDGSDSWKLKVLFPNRDALSQFHDYCVEHGFSFELQRVYQPENPQEEAEYEVTDEQQEALVAAYHAGYFDVPRDRTLTELADELDISRNALSARLRRGHRNLLANTLVHEEGGEES